MEPPATRGQSGPLRGLPHLYRGTPGRRDDGLTCWAGRRAGDDGSGTPGRRSRRPGRGNDRASAGRPMGRWCADRTARRATFAVARLTPGYPKVGTLLATEVVVNPRPDLGQLGLSTGKKAGVGRGACRG